MTRASGLLLVVVTWLLVTPDTAEAIRVIDEHGNATHWKEVAFASTLYPLLRSYYCYLREYEWNRWLVLRLVAESLAVAAFLNFAFVGR